MSKHLTEREVLAYIEGELAPRRREQAAAHLQACADCRAQLARMDEVADRLTETLQAVGEKLELTPQRSWERVRRARTTPQPGRLTRLLRPSLSLATMLALVSVLVIGLAGLVHTLAVPGVPPSRPTPTPSPTPYVAPSSGPGPIPRVDGQRGPRTILILGGDAESADSQQVDALMVIYLGPEGSRACVVSIPRELHVDVPEEGPVSAGALYEVGGLGLAKKRLSEVVGLPIERAVFVRLRAFVTLIDALGGVTIEVPHAIDDRRFPDGRGGTETFAIDPGERHLDGETALKYARTRVVPAEGFDRAFRQRQLALAVGQRIARPGVLMDLIADVPALWPSVADDVEGDISLGEAIDLALQASELTAANVTTVDLGACCTTPGGDGVIPQPDTVENAITSCREGR